MRTARAAATVLLTFGLLTTAVPARADSIELSGRGFSGSGFAPRKLQIITPESAPVPEPASMFLLGTGLAGLVAARRRRR